MINSYHKFMLVDTDNLLFSLSGPTIPKSSLIKVTKDRVKAIKKATVVDNLTTEATKSVIEEKVEEKEEPPKKSFFSSKAKSKYSYNNKFSKPTKFKQNIVPLKKSLFGSKNRKPGKSGLCKIINCSRNKSHYCCKDDEVEEVVEIETKEEEEANEIVKTETEKKIVASDKSTVKEVKNTEEEKNAIEETDLDKKVEQEIEGQTPNVDQENISNEGSVNISNEIEISTMMSYDDITTTLKYSNDEDVSEDDTVNYQEIDNNTEVSSGLDETSTMMNYQEYTQMDDEELSETTTVDEQVSESVTEQDILEESSEETSSESFEEVTMVSKSKSESYEETRIWYDGINDKGEFIEKKPRVYQDENGDTVVQVYPVYIPNIPPEANIKKFLSYDDIDNEIDNNVDNTIHDDRDTDIINEITCENVDCLAWPSNKCCSPHVAKKRHSQEELNDNITATIIRIVKSVRWV